MMVSRGNNVFEVLVCGGDFCPIALWLLLLLLVLLLLLLFLFGTKD